MVKIKDLTGKIVCLYFTQSASGFTPTLINVYKELSSKGDFEVVSVPVRALVCWNKDDEFSKEVFPKMPWLAIPPSDSATIESLEEKLMVKKGFPKLVILDRAGKVVTDEGVNLIATHGEQAYPFTFERINQVKEEEEEAKRNQSLKSLLICGFLDYVISNDGKKVPVSQLVGKHVLVYFSHHGYRYFDAKIVKLYNKVNAKERALEIIYVSGDYDQASFDKYLQEIPWLALPFGDERKSLLSRRFTVTGLDMPRLVSLGPDGKTITTEARDLIDCYGADAFPFTKEHINKLDEALEEKAKGWPEKVKNHTMTAICVHGLLKVRKGWRYSCDECYETGHAWAYSCDECGLNIHPDCALANDEGAQEENGDDTCSK